jgi:leucyl aminopeptidase
VRNAQWSIWLISYLCLPADDDGSGTTSTIHAFRALCESGYVPTTSDLEFHWYSAEEGGLLGSQAIAKSYEQQGVVVKGMVQMDMTAWVKKGTEEVVGVITDFVDPA